MGNTSKTSCKWLWIGGSLSKFDERFIKNYDENSDKGYFLEVGVEYPKKLLNLHSNLPFLSEGMKTKKYNKPVCNTQDKENYVVHIRVLKQKSTQSNSI